MMATPVAIALVWTMMFHPQLGVLNYLLTCIGLPPSSWVYNADTVIPTLVMVETWQWTPLVMLIVLGGIASLPIDPYEAAAIDGATGWQMFRYITLPLIQPFIIVATVMRIIDALKAFDIIFVITGGGPGTASETINMLLYQTAFGYYDLGYASAMVVVFFVLIMAAQRCAAAHAATGADAVIRGEQRPRPRSRATLRIRARLAAIALRRWINEAGLYLSVVVLISPSILFFLWMLSLSLKNEADNTVVSAGVHPASADTGELLSTCSRRTTS